MRSIRRRTRLSLSLALALAAFATTSCTVTLVEFNAPSVVATGAVFDLTVIGSGASGSYGDMVGVALQVPAGFSVEAADSGGGLAPLPTNAPAFTSLFTPEPTATLVFLSAQVTGFPAPTTAVARFRIRAPFVPGAYAFKVALAATQGGVWTVNAPAGGGDFALIGGGAHLRTVSVTTDSSQLPTWRPKPGGLVNGFGIVYQPYEYDVALGDFDADGRIDIVAGEAQGGPGGAPVPFLPRLYRGRVVEGFSASAPFGSLGLSKGAGAADFNADGIDDLFLDLQVRYGQAGGGFSVGPAVPLLIGPNAGIAIADFDVDGLPDVAVCDGPTRVYLTAPIGGFVSASTGLPTVGSPAVVDVLAPDLDGDGDPDLVLARQDGVSAFRNDGPAGWSGPTAPTLPNPADLVRFATAGDVDGDGDADLVVGVDLAIPTSPAGSFSWSSVLMLYRNDGTVWTPVAGGLPTAQNYGAAIFADIDEDGLLDLVAATTDLSGGVIRWGTIEIWRNAGGLLARSLALETGLPTGGLGNVHTIRHFDVDGDGRRDLVLNGSFGLALYARQGRVHGAILSTIGRSLGQAIDVLTVNGLARDPSTQAVAVAPSQPITVALAQNPFTPFASRFYVFGTIGWPTENGVYATVIGDLPFVPAVVAPGGAQLFGLADSFGLDSAAFLTFLPPGSLSFTLANGMAIPIVFSLAAILDDPTTPPVAIGVSNTVIVDVR